MRGETYELEDIDNEWKSVWSAARDRRPARLGRAAAGRLRVAHGAAGLAGGAQDRDVGRRAPEPPAAGHRHPAVRVGDRSGHGDRPDARRRAPDEARDRRRRPPDGAPAPLAERMGFEPVRHFLEVARPTASRVADVAAPAGLELVPWSPELDEGARLAHVEAFEDHWGSEPRTVEEWTQWYTGHRGFRPDLSVLAVEPASGEVVVARPVRGLPAGLGHGAGGGVDQHRRHPARLARQGGGVVAHDRRARARSRRPTTASSGRSSASTPRTPPARSRVYRRLGFSEDVRSVTSLNLDPV